MTAELAWTNAMPTRPGLYAWRCDWGTEDSDGALISVIENADRDELLAIEHIGVEYARDERRMSWWNIGGEWLGPLPE